MSARTSPRAGSRRETLRVLQAISVGIKWAKNQMDVGTRVFGNGELRHISDDSLCTKGSACRDAQFSGHTMLGPRRTVNEYPENNHGKLDELAAYLRLIAATTVELATELERQARELRNEGPMPTD